MRYLIVFFTCITILFSSCKTSNILMEPKSDRNTDLAILDSVFAYDATYQYHIRKDDKISISVWGEDELSIGSSYGIYNSNEVYGKWLMVDADGNIEIPKLGTFNVLNMTVINLKNILKERFGKWLVTPIVDIKVLNKEITVLGEVRLPQVIKIDKDHNSLLEIIARCNGFEFYANIEYIKILRQEGEHVRIANIDMSKSGDYISKNIMLRPGDVVVVPSKSYKTFDKRISTIIPF
ncbi:MAG: polysaccharide export protein, partial [Flavobacteriaceae bacterium]|nr:polysaccharide export protein [Flavobacteriaceae bacterium]